jgi:hypothetical protein
VRRAGAALVLAAALGGAAPAALADPPHTCGRIIYGGNAYVIRAHRVTCSFATRSARTFLALGAAPRGYKCRAAQGSVPVTCTHRVRRSRYFFATQVR